MTRTDLITQLIISVAHADGVDPAEVDALYDYIDPEVLHLLEELERGDWRFTFQFSDHQITVTHDHRILIDGVPYAPNTSTR